MSGYELVYFNCRGRGHHIRYLFHDQGIEYKETVVSLPPDDEWPTIKGQMQFGQIPCLKDGDFQLVQSNAILRHLGRKHGLYGNGINEAAMIDMVNDGVEDGRTKCANMVYYNYEAGKAPYIKETMPKMLEQFQSLLSANDGGKGFVAGNKISFVDYNLFDFLDSQVVMCPDCLDAYPVLKAYHERMLIRPGIKAFRETDLHKQMKVNGNDTF